MFFPTHSRPQKQHPSEARCLTRHLAGTGQEPRHGSQQDQYPGVRPLGAVGVGPGMTEKGGLGRIDVRELWDVFSKKQGDLN